jgi:hypothetical protein
MSTDDSQPTPAPTGAQPASGDPGDPGALNAPGAPHTAGGPDGPGGPFGTGQDGFAEQPEPGWFERNATLVISVSVAVIAVAAALVALFFYRGSIADKNDDTEAAVRSFIEKQGQKVESVQCDDGDCSVIVEGAAYSVLVHEDKDGDQHFGVSAYTGS